MKKRTWQMFGWLVTQRKSLNFFESENLLHLLWDTGYKLVVRSSCAHHCVSESIPCCRDDPLTMSQNASSTDQTVNFTQEDAGTQGTFPGLACGDRDESLIKSTVVQQHRSIPQS